MTERARDLRIDVAEAERLIWHRVHHHRPRSSWQLFVGNYILDLACRTAKLAIEFDGSQHLDSAYDVGRTCFLKSVGWRVPQFWNADVIADSDGVTEAILAAVTGPRGPTHPQSLLFRERR